MLRDGPQLQQGVGGRGLGRAHVCRQASQNVRGDGHKCIVNLAQLLAFGARFLADHQLALELVAVDQVEQIFEAQVSGDFVRGVVSHPHAWHFHKLDVPDLAVVTHDALAEDVLRRVAVRAQHPVHLPHPRHRVRSCRRAAAHLHGVVSRIARNVAVRAAGSQPRIVVRVVDGPVLDAPGPPRKGHVTLRAEHLITPIDFVDGSGAAGTGLGVATQQAGGGHVGGIARVWRVLDRAKTLVALRARPRIAGPALELGTQEAAALGRGTRAHKGSPLPLGGVLDVPEGAAAVEPGPDDAGNPVAGGVPAIAQAVELILHLDDAQIRLPQLLLQPLGQAVVLDQMLTGRQQRDLPFHQHLLPVALVVAVHKGSGQVGGQKFAVDRTVARHAVGIVGALQDVLPHARRTALVRALHTGNAPALDLGVGHAAHGTLHCHGSCFRGIRAPP